MGGEVFYSNKLMHSVAVSAIKRTQNNNNNKNNNRLSNVDQGMAKHLLKLTPLSSLASYNKSKQPNYIKKS